MLKLLRLVCQWCLGGGCSTGGRGASSPNQLSPATLMYAPPQICRFSQHSIKVAGSKTLFTSWVFDAVLLSTFKENEKNL